MDQKAQSSFEVLLLLGVVIIIAVLVGLYLQRLATSKPAFLRDVNAP